MILSYFPFLAAGRSDLLGGEDWFKVLRILKDNPHIICVLRKDKILLFSKESGMKIHKGTFPSLREALRDLSLDLKLVDETENFWVCEVPKAEFVLEMEKLAHEITTFLDENREILKEGDKSEMGNEKVGEKTGKKKASERTAKKASYRVERRAK